jgi:hypothetical protein
VHLGKPVIMGIENVMHSFKGEKCFDRLPRKRAVWGLVHRGCLSLLFYLTHLSIDHSFNPPTNPLSVRRSTSSGIFRGKSVTDVTVEEATVVSVSKTVAVVSAKVLIVGSGGKSQTRTVATNVFEMHPRYKEWLVISHHSSPILFPDIPKQQVKNE